jgi:hypothetical protein
VAQVISPKAVLSAMLLAPFASSMKLPWA